MNLIKYHKSLFGEINTRPYIAVSNRKLNPNYTGPCMQVKREGEPDLYDIHFDENGIISIDELRYYSGAVLEGKSVNSPFSPSSLSVAIWYGQNNQNDFIPPNHDQSPYIVRQTDSTTFELKLINNIPAIVFIGNYNNISKVTYLRFITQTRDVININNKNTFMSIIFQFGTNNNSLVFGVSNNGNGNLNRTTDWQFKTNGVSPYIQGANDNSTDPIPSLPSTTATNIYYTTLISNSTYRMGEICRNTISGEYIRNEKDTFMAYPSISGAPINMVSYYYLSNYHASAFNGSVAEVLLYNIPPLEYDNDHMRILHNQLSFYENDPNIDNIIT